MKILKCDLCDFVEKGENFEAWMNALKKHYGEKHMDFMMQKGNLTDEEKMDGMKKWMEDNKTRFDTEPETNQKRTIIN